MKREELLSSQFLSRLDRLAFLVKNIRRGRSRGEHGTWRRGSSLEFYDYRAYEPGDDLRYIDHHIMARLGKLVTKVFSAEEDLTIHFLIDASASMNFGNPTKLLYACRLCAALSYIGIMNLDRVGITWFKESPVKTLPPMRGRNMFPILDFLSGIEAGGTTGFNRSLSECAGRTDIPGLAVVISDLLVEEGYMDGLASLVYHHWDVVLFHLMDRNEYAPDFQGEVRLQDAETDRQLDLVVDSGIRKKLKESMNSYAARIERFCLDKSIEYVPVRTDKPFEKAILAYLEKGRYLR
ncbi:MAG: DUF58 domain-containing protein [Spirochaetales bacterium]|nr:DUF58 domain-containing protein [Spirochaetales bacterium]